MSKELEALKTIGDLGYIDEYDCLDGSLKQHFNEEFTTIEKALLRLELIDNSKPSEALECLDYLYNSKIFKYVGDEEYFIEQYNTIKSALLKTQEMEKELADVEMVKSGKTIIHIGKDLVMMNKTKYKEYVELENEPVSKRILQAKCEEQEKVWEILKPLCEVVETPVRKDRYLKINGVVVYTFKTPEEFELLKEVLK